MDCDTYALSLFWLFYITTQNDCANFDNLQTELQISAFYRRIINDSLRTDVCLLYPPYLIALGK